MTARFHDRRDAGKYLAEKIKLYIKNNFNSEAKRDVFIVMAIPRGGVIIGDIIASELNLDMDIIISKKIGAENNPELAIGAIMADGSYILNEDIVNRINISDEYIHTQIELQKKEIERRLIEFKGKKEYHNNLKDKIIILVDDGIATGATILAAVKWIKEKQHCKKLIVAVPVAPAESNIIDKLDQVSDKEVKEIMNKYNLVTL